MWHVNPRKTSLRHFFLIKQRFYALTFVPFVMRQDKRTHRSDQQFGRISIHHSLFLHKLQSLQKAVFGTITKINYMLICEIQYGISDAI